MATKYKRRKKLIDKRFQIPIALTLAGSGLVMLVFHFVIVDYLIASSRRGAVLEPRPFLHIAPMMVVLVGAYYWLGIVVSHRIVGPAYRLVQTMKGLEEGNFSIRAHLRNGDGLKDVATELNALADSLEARKTGSAEALGELRKAINGGADHATLLGLVGEAESLWHSIDEAGAEPDDAVASAEDNTEDNTEDNAEDSAEDNAEDNADENSVEDSRAGDEEE